MKLAELKRITLTGDFGDLEYAGNDLIMPINNFLGERIGTVTFYDVEGDIPLEDINESELEVNYFDFM